MKKRDYNKLRKRAIQQIAVCNKYFEDNEPTAPVYLGVISAYLDILEFTEWCPLLDEELREMVKYDERMNQVFGRRIYEEDDTARY